MSQAKSIINYIDKHGCISSLVAAKKLNITSTQRRISDLEELGYVFNKPWRVSNNGKRFIEYSIKRRPKK